MVAYLHIKRTKQGNLYELRYERPHKKLHDNTTYFTEKGLSTTPTQIIKLPEKGLVAIAEGFGPPKKKK